MRENEFDRIYREQFEPVYRYALALTRSAQAAEELTQATFFKALQAIDGFRGDSSLKSWLCAIAKNLWLSERRRAEPLPLEELPEAAERTGGPEVRALEKGDALRVHRALHALPEPYKEVFTLRVFGQLGFREIGELFGKTENWACVVYHRARGKLRAEMEETK